MRHLKLGGKIMIIGIILVVFPMGLIGLVSVSETAKSISELSRQDLSIIAGNLADMLTQDIKNQITTVRTIATAETIIIAAEKSAAGAAKGSRADLALANSQLVRIKSVIGDSCSSVNLVDRNGVVIASSNEVIQGSDVSDRDFTMTALEGISNVGAVIVSKFTGRILETAACPVFARDGKTILGAVTMGIEIDYLTNIIDRVKIGKTGYASIMTETGVIVAHPQKDLIFKANIRDFKGTEPLTDIIERYESGIVEYAFQGTDKIASVATVPLAGWSVITTMDRNDLYSLAIIVRNQIIVVCVVSLIAAALLIYFFSRSITLPLNRIVRAAEDIAAGDLTMKVEFEGRYDEVGSLSRAFNLMIKSLNTVAGVAGRIASGDLTAEVAPVSERDILGNAFSTMAAKLRTHLAGISEGLAVLTSAGSEILAATTQVVSGTAETASAIGQTTATVEEVRQAAQLSSDKAQNVSDNSQHVNEASESGQKAVEDTADVMLSIRSQMETITQSIVRLSEQSQSIGGIIESVTELADQSNLLAVNTALEAARAGDQGKGFAVIAMEIRNLAEQSKQATGQIRSILLEVQKLTGEAVMSVEQGTKAVEAGVEQAARAGEAIRVLTESSTVASQAAMQIVTSSRQQVIGMEQVGLAMANINQAGMQTASSMRQAEIVAKNLHDLGVKLSGLVEQYRT